MISIRPAREGREAGPAAAGRRRARPRASRRAADLAERIEQDIRADAGGHDGGRARAAWQRCRAANTSRSWSTFPRPPVAGAGGPARGIRSRRHDWSSSHRRSSLSLTMAGLYAAIAAGLTLTVGVTRIINFAHGEFVMLGAFLDLLGCIPRFGVSPWLGMLASGVATRRCSRPWSTGFPGARAQAGRAQPAPGHARPVDPDPESGDHPWSPDPRVMQAPPCCRRCILRASPCPATTSSVALRGRCCCSWLMLRHQKPHPLRAR